MKIVLNATMLIVGSAVVDTEEGTIYFTSEKSVRHVTATPVGMVDPPDNKDVESTLDKAFLPAMLLHIVTNAEGKLKEELEQLEAVIEKRPRTVAGAN